MDWPGAVQSSSPASSRLADTLASWRDMADPRTVAPNLAAGAVVAAIAIPLNLALAIACGLPPSAGLIGGAVGGLVGALFGGARLNITGPEVALAPLTAAIVLAHGIDGMLIATALAGAIQIGLGLSGVGGLVRLLPRPVIGGFLAAVGIMVFDAQLPHLIGVHDGGGVAAIAGGISDELSAHGTAVGVGLAVIVVLLVMPRLAPRVPAPLVALALAIGAVAWLDLPVERVTPITGDVLALRVPDASAIDWAALIPSAVALAMLASLDSLLCAVSIDARLGGRRHDPDQELVAQGVANLACSVVGGMPVASAVVRSVAAIDAGGTSRLCGVVQSVILVAVLSICGAHLDVVPLAALSGVLLVVGAKLVDGRELARLARVRRFDAVVFVVTAAAIVATGFVEGLLIGLALTMVELARAHGGALRISARTEGPAAVVTLEGPLVFASQHNALRRIEEIAPDAPGIVLELEGVTQWDSSGLAALRTAIEARTRAGASVEIVPGRTIPQPALESALGGAAAMRRPAGSAPRSVDAAPGRRSPASPSSVPVLNR